MLDGCFCRKRPFNYRVGNDWKVPMPATRNVIDTMRFMCPCPTIRTTGSALDRWLDGARDAATFNILARAS